MKEYCLKSDPSIWVPQPGPQTQAYDSLADELFYGGAQGGGKSDLLLGLAGTQHHHSIIFRRTFPLHRSLIERSREIFNALNVDRSRDPYNESLHRWSLPGGRLIEFGAMEYEKDRENWRGRPHDLYGFDEGPQLTESQYRFVIAWCRSTKPGQRCRVVLTGNPPTSVEGEWVIRYWGPWLDSNHPNPAKPGELRWFSQVKTDKGETIEQEFPDGAERRIGGELIKPRSRTFIPALLKDNPILEKTGYLSQIQSLPEPLRSQALYGDFSIGLTDDAWQVIPTSWVRAAQKRWRPEDGIGIPLSAIGVDPNYGGGDQMCIAPRRGTWFGPIKKYRGKQAGPNHVGEGEANAALIMKEHEFGAAINIDMIGWGAATLESLKRYEHMMKSSPINAVNVAMSLDMYDKSRRLKLVNVRAALYWKMREALDPNHGEGLALPPDNELLADLCSARYELTSSGIKIEEKKKIKERIGRSPDAGEAVMLAHWYRSGHPSVPDPELLEKLDKQFEASKKSWLPPDDPMSEAFDAQGSSRLPDSGGGNWRKRGIFGR